MLRVLAFTLHMSLHLRRPMVQIQPMESISRSPTALERFAFSSKLTHQCCAAFLHLILRHVSIQEQHWCEPVRPEGNGSLQRNTWNESSLSAWSSAGERPSAQSKPKELRPSPVILCICCRKPLLANLQRPFEAPSPITWTWTGRDVIVSVMRWQLLLLVVCRRIGIDELPRTC